MSETKDPVALVVIETGAVWPARTSELQAHLSRTLVESQVVGEDPAAFAQRVRQRVLRLDRRGSVVRVAVLSCNGRSDEQAIQARSALAQALCDSMVEARAGELVITGEQAFDEDARHGLFALAGQLCEGLKGSPVAVRVRFTAEESSGLRNLAPDLATELVADSA